MCVAYRLDGGELDEPPMDPEDMARAEPVYAEFAGWEPTPRGARHRRPAGRRARLRRHHRAMVGVPFCLVSVGPDREETIRLRDPFAPLGGA